MDEMEGNLERSLESEKKWRMITGIAGGLAVGLLTVSLIVQLGAAVGIPFMVAWCAAAAGAGVTARKLERRALVWVALSLFTLGVAAVVLAWMKPGGGRDRVELPPHMLASLPLPSATGWWVNVALFGGLGGLMMHFAEQHETGSKLHERFSGVGGVLGLVAFATLAMALKTRKRRKEIEAARQQMAQGAGGFPATGQVPGEPSPAAPPLPPGGPADAGIAQLKEQLRRGEISEDEFVERARHFYIQQG